MPTIGTVLVLGAYGLAGREIVAGLLAKTDLRVIASGRNTQKLEALTQRLAHPRLSTRPLDAYDAEALAKACGDADVVINAVGPYTQGGAEIARTVLEAKCPYVDFANEQTHYRRLESLDALARRREVLLLTGAGLVPGLSTLIVLHAAEQLPDAQEVDVCYAQGRAPDEESGLGSALGGVVELSILGGRIARRVET
ncbi:MAG: saccharopine dehydrogenase NADP-binding domain-containing protein, partial [Planctomycetota bacterium]